MVVRACAQTHLSFLQIHTVTLAAASADVCTFLQTRKELSTGDEDRVETMHAFLANWGADASVQGFVANVTAHWPMTFFNCFCATARDLWPGTNYALAFLCLEQI